LSVLGTEPPKQGLLGRVGNFLRSPAVTGVGLAAATGFNPLLGLLAAPMIKSSREGRALELDAAREKLLAMQRQREAGSAVQDLLRSLTTSELAPGEMGPPLPPPIGGVQGDFLRTLGQADPSAALSTVGGLLGFGKPERGTSFLKEAEALGVSPDEARELWIKRQQGQDISGQMASIQANLAALEVERRREQVEAARRERETSEKTDRQERFDIQSGISRDVARGLEAADLLSALEGSLAQTGEGADLRRFGVGLLGLLRPEDRQLAAQAERFNQIATDFGVRTLEALKGTGSISQRKFDLLVGNSLSASRTPEANRAALADIFETIIDAGDKLDLSVPDRERIEALIPQLREGITAPPGSGVRVIGVRRKQ
jgi:hypothetical protein